MGKDEPLLRPGGYVKKKEQPSAEWFKEYLVEAAGILEEIERTGYAPNATLERQYIVLSEIANELNLGQADGGVPQYPQILANFKRYQETGDYRVLNGTADLIRDSVKAIVNRANRFAELDNKVSASAGSIRVMENVEKELTARRGKEGFGYPGYGLQRTGTDG